MTKPARRRGRPPHPDTLTSSEWNVLHMLRHGLTNAQITRARRTSADATKFHVRNIAAKLDVRGRVALRHWNGTPAPQRSATHDRRPP